MKHQSEITRLRWPAMTATSVLLRARQRSWLRRSVVIVLLLLGVALATACQAQNDLQTQPDRAVRSAERTVAPALRAGVGVRDASPRQAQPVADLNGAGATFHITWRDDCETQPAGAETALDYAAAIWGGLVSSPVTVEVSACWTSSLPCDGIACGDTATYARNFPGAPLVDTYYPIGLANALAGTDLAPASFDITVYFQAGDDWSFATDGPATGTLDFVTAALHELCHGLGFSGNMYESYNVGFCGTGPFYWYLCPTPYDRLAVDSDGVSLLSHLEPDPRVLGTKLKSDANFGGLNAVAKNSGDLVKLYTPAVWDQGTSLTHLDPEAFDGGENVLMLPHLYTVRSPGPVTLAMLQDMGWLLANGAPNVTQSGPVAVGIGHDAEFKADLLWPDYAGQTISYAWTATDQITITHAGRGITDSVTLDWATPGLKTVSVTATGADSPASATRSVLAFDVGVSGYTQGDVGQEYTFYAELAPTTTALMVTYRWDASDQATVTHSDQGTADAIPFTWATPGTKTITVTATIAGEPAQATHTFQIGGTLLDQFVYLPLVRTP